MFCIKCGKKIPDIALFCPACGTPVDKADEEELAPAEDIPEPGEKFVPLSFDDEEDAPSAPDEAVDVPEKPVPAPAPEPLTLSGRKPVLDRGADKDEDDDGLFLDDEDGADDDKPDPDEMYDADYDRDYDESDDYVYEEPEKGSFFVRHIRGIIALGLTLMLALVLLLWASTVGGQKVLAKLDIAWQASAYADIGAEYYKAGSFNTAAKWYEKAYDHSNENVYALNCGICCDRYGQTDAARKWYITSIKADPRVEDGYLHLLDTYTSIDEMSDEVQTYMAQGYSITRNERLNLR